MFLFLCMSISFYFILFMLYVLLILPVFMMFLYEKHIKFTYDMCYLYIIAIAIHLHIKKCNMFASGLKCVPVCIFSLAESSHH